MAYYAVAHEEFVGKTTMATLKEFIKPEISIGTMIVLTAQLAFATAWILNDHALTIEAKAQYEDLKASVESMRMTLPLTIKDVDINSKNINALQAQQLSVEDRISKLEQTDALITQTLENLRSEQQYNKEKR